MSMEEIKRFSEAIDKSPEIQEKIKHAGHNKEEFVKIANSLGYHITDHDLDQLSKLSHDELDNIAGGSERCIRGICDIWATDEDRS